MPTVPELVDRLDALRKARALGVRIVRTADGRSVEYKDDGEMGAAAADLEKQITTASGVPLVHTVLVSSTKGLDS